MKRKNISILCVLLSFCLCACQQNDDELMSDLEASCELKSPNGDRIAHSVLDLKEKICDNVNLPIDEVEIIEIKYADILQGYMACVTYLTKDGNVGCVGVTNHRVNELGEVNQEDNISFVQTRSETDILDIGGGYLIVCRAVSSGCRHCYVEFDIYDSGELKYRCGCHSGTDSGASCSLTMSRSN